jgi:ligand-binding SRPBCC domain-containing protein
MVLHKSKYMYLVGWRHFLFLHASVTSENTDDIRDTVQKNISSDLEFVANVGIANILSCMTIYRTSAVYQTSAVNYAIMFIVDNIHSSDVSKIKDGVFII